MQALRFFSALAAPQKWIQHLTDYGTWTDDRDLHDDVIKTVWPEAGKTRHLRAAFHLKQPDGVGFLQRLINQRVVLRQMREVDFFAICVADELDGGLEHGHHAEPQQIHFDDPHVGAVFLVPLDDDASWHCCRLEGNDGIELALADNHAAGMLAEMAWQILGGHVEIEELGY